MQEEVINHGMVMIALQLSFEITVQVLKSQSAAYLIQQRLVSCHLICTKN